MSELAAKNASVFGAGGLGEVCGLLHDIGKYSDAFVKRLEDGPGGPRVDHSTAGAKIAAEKWQGDHFGKMIAYVVAGHHAGLANGIDAGDNRSTLFDRLDQRVPEISSNWEDQILLPDSLPIPAFTIAKNRGFQLAFLTRMLFSCLVDADFIDTDKFYRNLDRQSDIRSNHPPLEILQQTIDQYLKRFTEIGYDIDPDNINVHRNEILQQSRAQAKENPGLFSLTVPTGGGKTITSMAFALDHAVQHNLRRIIYVIPFTSIIDQNARVFREIFKDLGEDIVLEHHSTFDDNKYGWNENTKDKLRLAMENWDAPIVVTTAVQFFESLFADRPSRCRKLHNIAGSVVILDEAQMLPLKVLRPTMAAIDELARNYRCSIVLCTATQPSLRSVDGFKNGFCNVREIAPEPERFYSIFDRVSVRHVGVQTDDQLAERLKSHRQILVIVNNRSHARALYEKIGKSDDHFHLTTLMCARHREIKLAQIVSALKAERPCKVISTSLIEAGVDIDFPAVMRAESGLDSIAQAAGRCNRHGKRDKRDSEVFVFQTNEWRMPPELEQRAASMRAVLRNHTGALLAPDAIKAFFQELFWQQEGVLDVKGLLKLHKDHEQNCSYPFQLIAKEYRIIESSMRPIIVPFDKDAEALIGNLRFKEKVGFLARKLQPYIVQVPLKAFQGLYSAGAIQPINQERFGDQFWELTNKDIYDKSGSGLHLEDPTFMEPESSVI